MHSFLPQLQTLSLVNSPHVTSVGIATLGTDANRCRNLQTLDITSCNNVRYGITLELRRQLQHANLVIRRQPVWMDGHFHTPYENDGVHTYWADGSFSFQRDDFNCGFVLQLWQWPSIPAVPISYECYGNRLQFCKFFPGLRSEPFTRYRPGVSLVQEPLENDHSLATDTMNTGAANVDGARSNAITATGLPRTIVVFQSERDAPPPSAWPTPIPDCLSSAPVGETKRYDELMVTRMAVTPFLDTERCMPPIHLVQEIEAFLERQPTADQLDL
jgi:hypothetical protein